jgi:tetratricopeptide (TPR) repeat protein
MAGDIEEGLDIMRDDTALVPNFAGLIQAGTAVQLGDPEMAEDALAARFQRDSISGDVIGAGEFGVVAGLAQLQLGKVTDAVAIVEAAVDRSHTEGERAFGKAVLALAYCALGEPENALAAANSLSQLNAGTYLDRMTAAVARGFAYVRLGRGDDADAALLEAVTMVDDTDDVLDQAVARLARGIGLDAMGTADATRVLADARTRLRLLDIDALGWETAFRLAAGR